MLTSSLIPLSCVHACVHHVTSGLRDEQGLALEKMLIFRLREIMMHEDLQEITCKQLRLQLEKQVNMDLNEYRGFLDQQMLRILGQMERPSQIFDYLYLVGMSLWWGWALSNGGGGSRGSWLGWAGLGWAGLGWAGLGWAGLVERM